MCLFRYLVNLKVCYELRFLEICEFLWGLFNPEISFALQSHFGIRHFVNMLKRVFYLELLGPFTSGNSSLKSWAQVHLSWAQEFSSPFWLWPSQNRYPFARLRMHFPGLSLWVFPLGTPGSNTGFWSDLPSSLGSRLCFLSVLCVWSESESRSVVSNSLRHHGLYSPQNSPGQNTGVGEQPFQQRAKPEVNYELRSIITYQYWLINCTKCTILINGGTSGEEPACQCRRHRRLRFDPWVRKIPWRRAWQSTPVFLPRESHRQRSLAGYSLWGHKSWTWLSD